MHFGVFIEEARSGLSQGDAFRESFETVDAAEALGLDCVWLGEIHFNPARSVISAPIAVATAIAARTKRIHVGTAVNVLPLNHPLRIAEEAATVDHLSEGRFELGIGRSGAARTYDVLGIPYGESQARFREALEIIKEAWKGQAFSYEGQFYRFQNATVVPRPYQKPYPPIRMRPADARYAAIQLPAGSPAVDATVRCVVLCWPVIDPLGRFHYAKKLKAAGPPYPDVVDRVLPHHDAYWRTEAAMGSSSLDAVHGLRRRSS